MRWLEDCADLHQAAVTREVMREQAGCGVHGLCCVVEGAQQRLVAMAVLLMAVLLWLQDDSMMKLRAREPCRSKENALARCNGSCI